MCTCHSIYYLNFSHLLCDLPISCFCYMLKVDISVMTSQCSAKRLNSKKIALGEHWISFEIFLEKKLTEKTHFGHFTLVIGFLASI